MKIKAIACALCAVVLLSSFAFAEGLSVSGSTHTATSGTTKFYDEDVEIINGGHLIVSGVDTVLETGSNLIVCNYGSYGTRGQLSVTDGGHISVSGTLFFARLRPTADSFVMVNNGTVETNEIRIGGADEYTIPTLFTVTGSNSVVTASAGGISITGGSSHLTVQGGARVEGALFVSIVQSPTLAGVPVDSGGKVTVTGTGSVWDAQSKDVRLATVYDARGAQLEITNGGLFTGVDTLHICYGGRTTGTVTVNSGTLQTNSIKMGTSQGTRATMIVQGGGIVETGTITMDGRGYHHDNPVAYPTPADNKLIIGNGSTAGSVIATEIASGTSWNSEVIFSQTDAVNGSNFTALMTGSLSITQAGPGTTTLVKNHTYTGVTQVTNGKLIIDVGASIGVGNVTVFTGGTLGGGGTINGLTAIDNKATLTPNGTLTFTNGLSVSSGATLVFGETDDIINVTGGELILDSGITLDLSALGNDLFGELTLFTFSKDVWKGEEEDWDELLKSWTVVGVDGWELAFEGGKLGIKYQNEQIPEPGTWVMILAGLGTLAGIQRLRRRQEDFRSHFPYGQK